MQNTRQRLRLAIVTIAAATASGLLLSSCSGDDGTAEAAAPVPADQVIEINLVDTAPGTKVKIAQAQGFFDKHKLKVNLSTLNNGTAVLSALQGGSADIGYADLFAGINANANRFKVRLVVANNHNTKSIPWLTKADSGIVEAKDIEGKTIGVAPVPQHTVNLRGFLKANGVDATKVKITTIDTAQASQEILQSGAVDVIQGQWPIAYANQGEAGQYDFRVLGRPETSQWTTEGATTAAFWSTLEWLEQNGEAAERFATAWREYNQWLLDRSQDERAALLEEYQKLDVQGLTGGDAEKIANLVGNTEQVIPFNFEASQDWYELGLQYAPDRIKPGVDLHEIVWKTAQ